MAKVYKGSLGPMRHKDVLPLLYETVGHALDEAYGPGYSAELRSGRGPSPRTHRHNDGEAGDWIIRDPNGRQLHGEQLLPLAQVWTQKYGSIGVNADAYNGTGGSFTHLDLVGGVGRPLRGKEGRLWFYGREPEGFRAAINDSTPRRPTMMAFAAGAGDGTPDPFGAVDRPTLRFGTGRGKPDPAVKALQERLNMAGANLDVDGVFGKRTQAAVRGLQIAYGAKTVDGVVGPETYGILDSIADPSPKRDLQVPPGNVAAAPPPVPAQPAPRPPVAEAAPPTPTPPAPVSRPPVAAAALQMPPGTVAAAPPPLPAARPPLQTPPGNVAAASSSRTPGVIDQLLRANTLVGGNYPPSPEIPTDARPRGYGAPAVATAAPAAPYRPPVFDAGAPAVPFSGPQKAPGDEFMTAARPANATFGGRPEVLKLLETYQTLAGMGRGAMPASPAIPTNARPRGYGAPDTLLAALRQAIQPAFAAGAGSGNGGAPSGGDAQHNSWRPSSWFSPRPPVVQVGSGNHGRGH